MIIKSIGATHIALAIVWGAVLVSVNYVELVFGHFTGSTSLLFLMLQNVGIALANSYYASSVKLNETGLTETTSKA